MGAGVGPLEANNLFWIYVDFEDLVGNPKSLDPSDPIYVQFVDKMKALVETRTLDKRLGGKWSGKWIAQPNPSDGSPKSGGLVLLRGVIQDADEAQQINCALDAVLRSVQNKRHRAATRSTGTRATVTMNQGPAASANENTPQGKATGAQVNDCGTHFTIRAH